MTQAGSEATDSEATGSKNEGQAGVPARCVKGSTQPRQRPLVLVAEDDAISARMMRRVLQENAAYDVEWVPDGEAALSRFHELHPDAVVLDLMMPGRNGFEVCRALKSDPATAKIPVCVVTGMADEDTRKMAVAHGADVILWKPLSPSELRLRLRGLMAAANETVEEPAVEDGSIQADIARELASLRQEQRAWAAMLAHELRGPLTVIHSTVAAFDPHQEGQGGLEQRQELVAIVDEALERLQRTVDGLVLKTGTAAQAADVKECLRIRLAIVARAAEYHQGGFLRELSHSHAEIELPVPPPLAPALRVTFPDFPQAQARAVVLEGTDLGVKVRWEAGNGAFRDLVDRICLTVSSAVPPTV